MMILFYCVTLAVALTGSGQAAVHWLDWYPPFAYLAVAGVELGAVALSRHADTRRQLGERATFARILSASVAVGAVIVNLAGHYESSKGQAFFFAGFSALGYLVYLIVSNANRRDALRRMNKLEDTAPSYGLAWMFHPVLTWEARTIALETGAGKTESMITARENAKQRKRTTAIASVLHERIKQDAGRRNADIAVTSFDVPRIAAAISNRIDHDGYAGIIADELRPEKLAKTSDTNAIVDVRRMSKTDAIITAAAYLGNASVAQIQEWLFVQGVEVSRSMIYAARKRIGSEALESETSERPIITTAPTFRETPKTPDNHNVYDDIDDIMGTFEEETSANPAPISPAPTSGIPANGSETPTDPYPDCPHEWHGADGGACPKCGWDSHPIPDAGTPIVLDLSHCRTQREKVYAVRDALTVDGFEPPSTETIRGVLKDHGLDIRPYRIRTILDS